MNRLTADKKIAASLCAAFTALLLAGMACAQVPEPFPDLPADVFAPPPALRTPVEKLERVTSISSSKKTWVPLEPDPEDKLLTWINEQGGLNLPMHRRFKGILNAGKGH